LEAITHESRVASGTILLGDPGCFGHRSSRGVRLSHPSRQLGYLFENLLPLPLEQVHAIYRRVPKQQRSFIGCAMDRAALDLEISQQDQTAADASSGFIADVYR